MRCNLFLFFLLITEILCAQTNHRFKNWNAADGLNAGNCLSLLQDQQGYIWIGTTNGISGFSGTKFYQGTAGGDPALSGEIRDLTKDENGVIWAASFENGVIAIDNKKSGKGRVRVYNSGNTPGAPPPLSVNRLYDDNRGTLWIGTMASGLFRFDKRSGTFSRVNVDHPYSKFEMSIRSFYADSTGKLMVGIVNGLFIIDLKTNQINYPDIRFRQLTYTGPPTIRKICYWNKDTFAIATDRGAHFYIPSTQTVIPVFSLKDSSELKLTEYSDVLRFSSDELWFATMDKGILSINPYTRKYYYLHENTVIEETVPPATVNRFMRDKKGNIWVAHFQGLSLYSPSNQVFNNVHVDFYPDEPFLRHHVVAGDNGAMYYNKGEVVYTDIPDQRGMMSIIPEFRKARFIIRYPGHGIFYNSRKGFFVFDERTKKVKELALKAGTDSAKQQLLFSQLDDALFDTLNGRNIMWITGLETRSLYKYDPQTGELVSFKSSIYSDTSQKYYGPAYTRIAKDADNGLWLASEKKGIFYIPDREKDEGRNFFSNQPENNFPGNCVRDIFFDRKQRLWAAVWGIGLVKINWRNPSKLSYTVYGREQGLTQLHLSRIQDDAAGNLWISSDDGLFCFFPEEGSFRLYNRKNGLHNQSFDAGSAKSDEGMLCFSAGNNLVYFDPAKVSSNKPAGKLIWQNVSTSDRVQSITGQHVLQLAAGENSFSISFNLLDFEIAEGHRFRYKLEGYDKEWQSIQDEFVVQYRNVPGGDYTFRIELMDESNIPESMFLQLSVGKFFYQQVWFRVVMFVFAILLIIGAIHLYTRRRLAVQHARFEREKAVEMERLRISSELHDDLGGGLSTIHLMTEMMRSPGFVERNEHFLSSISEKSQELVQNINEIVWSLNHNNDDLAGLLAYIRQYAVKYLDEAGILLEYNQPTAILSKEITGNVRRHLFLIVKEALHNIVKHANASRVVIDIETDHMLKISICDNGKGLTEKKDAHGSGNGLRNIRSRAHAIGGSIVLVNGQGTMVVLEMPLPSQHNKSTISQS